LLLSLLKPLDGYRLLLTFSTGEKIYDMKHLLDLPVFRRVGNLHRGAVNHLDRMAMPKYEIGAEGIVGSV